MMDVGSRGKGRMRLIYCFACEYETVLPRSSKGEGSLGKGS